MIAGGCACGAVRYQASGPPRQSMICHCRDCRRAAAAPVVAWVTFASADFAMAKGAPAAFASSRRVRRRFCAACGTPLTYAHEARPDEIDVTTCSLDDPDAFPPTHHSQLADDLHWVRFGDGLPAYAGWKPAD